MKKQLSPSLQRTLLAIHQLQVEKGYMPTIREIADKRNYYSRFTIQYQVDKLVELGYLSLESDGTRRSISRSMRFARSLDYQGKSIPVLGVCN